MQYLLLGSLLKQGISKYREEINTWACAIGHAWVGATEWAIVGLLRGKSSGSNLRGQPVVFLAGFPLDYCYCYCSHFSSGICPLLALHFQSFFRSHHLSPFELNFSTDFHSDREKESSFPLFHLGKKGEHIYTILYKHYSEMIRFLLFAEESICTFHINVTLLQDYSGK